MEKGKEGWKRKRAEGIVIKGEDREGSENKKERRRIEVKEQGKKRRKARGEDKEPTKHQETPSSSAKQTITATFLLCSTKQPIRKLLLPCFPLPSLSLLSLPIGM